MSKTINNISKSLKDLGLTEEQVQGLIDARLIDINTRIGACHESLTTAWSTINEINTRELNGQQYKLSDNYGYCQNLHGCNWNDVKRCGYYMGASTTNAPENSSDWFMVHVMAHNDIWCEQIATAFSSTQKRYIRYQLNGSWTAWRSL